jgi:ubiquinone/menaquinone biosynthesis C-methylase UbiE
MLRVGRDRLTDKGVILPTLVCDAEKLPFPDNYFDLVSVAFGLRNMTHKDAALGNEPRAAPRRQAAGAGVLQGGQTAGESL